MFSDKLPKSESEEERIYIDKQKWKGKMTSYVSRRAKGKKITAM